MEQFLNEKLEAILWDFGGVFTTSPFENFNLLEERCGATKDFIRTINSINPTTNAWAQFESNQVTLEEFDELFATESKLAGHEIRGKEVISMLSGDLRPKMVDLLKLCKKEYKVACITNNVKAGRGPGMSSDDVKASKVSKVMELFDDVIESSIEGIRKPNPEIYKLACRRLSVEPDKCLFIDDLGINLKPAKEMGMRTVKVLSEAQALEEICLITNINLN
tara:strand:+ start:101 stop:763 length:663 start_codon:yes stop_codon:yes gene_type:complete